jgi:uncharacterized protein
LPRRQNSFRNVALLLLLPVAGLLAFLVWVFVRSEVPASSPARVKRTTSPSPVAPRSAERVPAGRERGKIVLILDDVGFDHQPLAAAMAIDPNINFSILPNAQHGAEYARVLHSHGFELLCHLPMEPLGFPGVSPGDGAVLTSMSDDEIARATTSNVSSVPYARGVNNHMGSRATADRRVMRSVISSLPQGMYFIDSRTTGASVGFAMARELKVPTAARNVFLDDIQTAAAVHAQLASLRDMAAERGMAIGIGHMYPVTIRELTNQAPVLRDSGFRFIRASEAVR